MTVKRKKQTKEPVAAKEPAAREPVAEEVVQEIHDQMAKDEAGNLQSLVGRFELAMQHRFRGAEEDVGRRLSVHLEKIQATHPPSLPWIDIGCGRGEWLEIASASGPRITGIDRNGFAVEHCRARQLPAVERDALEYLRELPAASCAVLTAFHVLENCGFLYILELLRESARVLAPGGVFVMETPNPANTHVATYQFWLDPMHLRLLPADLMMFTLQYFGLQAAHPYGLNPDPHHGAQDYAIIAVR